MPTYTYKCVLCDKKIEVIHSMNETYDKECSCGSLSWEPVINNYGGFQLKGSGWYKDGYAYQKEAKKIKEDPITNKTNDPAKNSDDKNVEKEKSDKKNSTTSKENNDNSNQPNSKELNKNIINKNKDHNGKDSKIDCEKSTIEKTKKPMSVTKEIDDK